MGHIVIPGNYTTHTIHMDYGWAFIRDLDGNYIEADELHQIINALQKTEAAIAKVQGAQDEIRAGIFELQLEKRLNQSRLYYPFEEPFSAWRHGQKRPFDAPRYSGVYFITHHSHPASVKIGKSDDVYARTKGLFHEMVGSADYITPIAFIDTKNSAEVEALLHAHFSEFSIGNEWFKLPPVIEWLEGQKHGR